MRLLLVEDKDSFRRMLVQALAGSPWEVLATGDPREALEALERSPFEVLVTDLRLPGMSGLELLKRAKRRCPSLRAVLMSAFGEPRDIVEAMRSGADEFLPKPFDLDLFAATLNRLLALVEAPPPDPREPWIAHAPASRTLDQGLTRAAEVNTPVLFLGERGVGKARAARRLHTLWNPQGPFLACEATALSAERHLGLMEEGTIYLTDLAVLPPRPVKGLLDMMDSPQGRRIRWMGGARSLEEVAEPLRPRLGVLCFELPPLRERREDVLPLFRTFLEASARRAGRGAPSADRAVERELLQRSWSGNVRELAVCAALALRACPGPILSSLPEVVLEEDGPSIPLPPEGSLEAMLAELARSAEPLLLRRALESHGRDAAATAASLGLTTRSLGQRLREHRIPLEEA